MLQELVESELKVDLVCAKRRVRNFPRGHLPSSLGVPTGGEDGRAGTGAQIGEGEAGATRQYKESAGGEEEGAAAMAERTGVADHRATGVAVVGGE
jgi:hypothetical protein